jgi:hypothetical protein
VLQQTAQPFTLPTHRPSPSKGPTAVVAEKLPRMVRTVTSSAGSAAADITSRAETPKISSARSLLRSSAADIASNGSSGRSFTTCDDKVTKQKSNRPK